MQRPEIPHNIALVVGLLLLLTNIVDAVPIWVSWIGAAIVAVVEIVLICMALRQGCRTYALYLLGILLFAAGFLTMTIYLGSRAGHLSPPSASKASSNASSNLENIGLGIATTGFILLFLFDLLRAWLAFRSRRAPEAYRGSSLFRYRIVIRLGILFFAASGVFILFIAS